MIYQFGNYKSGQYPQRPRIFTDAINLLIITNVVVFGILFISGQERFLFRLFGIVPRYFWRSLMIWQPVTYLFLHAGFWHILINMFVLWMFGSELEMVWGKKSFLKYFFLTGVGSGLVTIIFNLNSTIPVVGASGAVYGILLAYGLMFPNRYVYLYFLFPIRVKYFVIIIGAIAFFSSFNTGTNISHLTHLSGMIIGFVYLRSNLRWKTVKSFLVQQKEDIIRRYSDKKKDEMTNLRKKVDILLDKISQEGYDSLTEEEQEFLQKASERLSKDDDRV